MRAPVLALALALVLALLAAAGAEARVLRVAVISDLNGRYGSAGYGEDVHGAVARIVELKPDLVISTGDMIAGQRPDPKLTEAELLAMWTAFRDAVAAPLAAAGIPLAVTPGNHDASAFDAYAAERDLYARVWAAPPAVEMADGAGWPFAYAFRLDGVLFVSLDATVPGALPARQMRWLDALLAREGGAARAVVAFTHLPLRPVAVGRETEAIADPALAALLVRHGTDLLLAGHHHAYYPGVAEGLLQVAQACLGGGPRALIGAEARSPRAITWLEIAEDGAISVRALAAPDFRREVPLASLPAEIATPAGTLTRLDLAPPR